VNINPVISIPFKMERILVNGNRFKPWNNQRRKRIYAAMAGSRLKLKMPHLKETIWPR
jgi:hypothetical protein